MVAIDNQPTIEVLCLGCTDIAGVDFDVILPQPTLQTCPVLRTTPISAGNLALFGVDFFR